jgi:NSS family neurotransmitter:Na+ symporter
MMFYSCVSGWMLKYFVDMAGGKFTGLDSSGVGAHFTEMLGNPVELTIYVAAVVVIGFIVCGMGVQKGLERVTKIMMLALLAIMVVLAINGFTLDGAKEGLKFYLVPDFNKMADIGIGKVIVSAMNQAFFTLSLGIGSMAIFGSYLNRDRSLLGESVNIAILDTSVAVTSGLLLVALLAKKKKQQNEL